MVLWKMLQFSHLFLRSRVYCSQYDQYCFLSPEFDFVVLQHSSTKFHFSHMMMPELALVIPGYNAGSPKYLNQCLFLLKLVVQDDAWKPKSECSYPKYLLRPSSALHTMYSNSTIASELVSPSPMLEYVGAAFQMRVPISISHYLSRCVMSVEAVFVSPRSHSVEIN